MPFTISVYKKLMEKPFPDNKDEQKLWLQEDENNCIYSNAFGTTGTVYEYWHIIALKLTQCF